MPEAELSRLITSLLRAEPQLQLERLSVGTGEEEMVVTGHAGLRASPGANWETLMLDPMRLLFTLDVQARRRLGKRAFSSCSA